MTGTFIQRDRPYRSDQNQDVNGYEEEDREQDRRLNRKSRNGNDAMTSYQYMMANFGLIDIQVHCERVCFVNNKTYECAVAKSGINVQKQRHF